MPSIRRKHPRYRGPYSAVHRRQLVDGADRDGQEFGRHYVCCRRRYGPRDFADMPFVVLAWHELKNEILAEHNAADVWAHRRLELGELPEVVRE